MGWMSIVHVRCTCVWGMGVLACFLVFFFNDTATTEIYTLSLHDALPILYHGILIKILFKKICHAGVYNCCERNRRCLKFNRVSDRKSTRLNSSHANISYAVFCLKKKKNIIYIYI